VIDNDIPGGEFDGLVLLSSDENRIESNLVHDHRGRGIRIANGVKNDLARNVVIGNGLDGILIEASSRRTRVHDGVTAENGDDGLDVEDPTARVVHHVATGNADHGIESVPGVRGAGNRASGNGNPEQCLNLPCR
jgi:parallel beta-helix repeat protein